MTDEDKTGNEIQKPEVTLDALAASLETAKGPSNDGDPAKVELPDPTADPEGFKAAMDGINGTLNSINDFVSQTKEADAEAKETADINAAVDTVASQVEGVDKKVIRAVLKDEVDTNPAFARLWEGRDKNPDAFNQALGILSGQYRDQFAPRVDPQVQSDQRAFQESVQAARGGKADEIASTNGEWSGKSNAEFDRDWHKLSGQGMM